MDSRSLDNERSLLTPLSEPQTDAHLLDENLTQARLPERVIFEIKLVKTMEYGLVSMHVQRIDIQIIRREIQRFKYFQQREELAIPKDDNLIWFLLELTLDEAQEMLLVHAC